MNRLQKGWQWVVGGTATLLVVAALGGISSHHAFAQENQGGATQGANAPVGEQGAVGTQAANQGQERQGGQNGQQDNQASVNEATDNQARGNEASGNENGRFQNEGFQGRGEGEDFLFLIPIAAVGLLGLWLARNWSNTNNRLIGLLRGASVKMQSTVTPAAGTPTALEIVKTRYAQGEINREQYEIFVRDLAGDAQPTAA